jgi:hypothetical protein
VTSRYEAADLGSVVPIPFSARENKVSVGQFGEILDPAPAIAPLIAALPDVLAAADLRRVVERWSASLDGSRAVVLLVGGHVVKTGCSPFLIDLVERGWVTHLAFNGATAIHDFEIACFGETSEDVAGNLADGTFGLADAGWPRQPRWRSMKSSGWAKPWDDGWSSAIPPSCTASRA